MSLDKKVIDAFNKLDYGGRRIKKPKIGNQVSIYDLVGDLSQPVRHLLIRLVENIPRDSTDAYYAGPCYVFKDRVIMRGPAMFVIYSDAGFPIPGQGKEFLEMVDHHTIEFELNLITEAYELVPGRD